MSFIFDEYAKDYFNLDKKRNSQNTDNWDYNCGGYALGTFSWFLLDSFEHGYDLNYYNMTIEEIEKRVVSMEDDCVEEIVEVFEGLVRSISTLSELREDEYAVLFRISYNDAGYVDDFHFVKRHHDGHYSHKPGRSPIVKFENDPFDGDWSNRCLVYNAPIKILAVSNLLY